MKDRLVISLLDVEVAKGNFKKELAGILGIEPSQIYDVGLESEYTNGVITQYLKVYFNYGKIKKENLMKLDFDHFDGGAIAFEVGDTFL